MTENFNLKKNMLLVFRFEDDNAAFINIVTKIKTIIRITNLAFLIAKSVNLSHTG